MPIKTNMDNSLKIIDKTVVEICKFQNQLKRLDIIQLCWLLKEIGTDIIEIDADTLERIGKLPAGIDFIYYIKSMDELENVKKAGIRRLVAGKNVLLDKVSQNQLKSLNPLITLELSANCFTNQFKLEKEIEALSCYTFDKIRISGSNCFSHLKETEALLRYFKGKNYKLDFCPSNKYRFATAIAYEAATNGADFVTASFMGLGRNEGFAALEEILISLKVLARNGCKDNLKALPEICNFVKRKAGIIIPDNKPVIGRNIFKYESGIHADGIEKNSATYEPFNPEIIGQRRELTIGKHSGRRSIIKKLELLEIRFNSYKIQDILSEIRENSIRLRRDLTDNEIRQICAVIA